MFQLVVAIVSIAIVAALAVASIYFGGKRLDAAIARSQGADVRADVTLGSLGKLNWLIAALLIGVGGMAVLAFAARAFS